MFPFLAPEPFARVAAAMPEGRSASIADLAARASARFEPALLDTVVDAGLRPYVSALAGRAASPWFAGFKVVRQEAGEADGGAADVDDAAPPDRADPASAEGPGDEAIGETDTCESLDVGDGLEVLFWFFFPLAAAGGAPSHLAWEATSRGGRAHLRVSAAGRSVGGRQRSARSNRGLASLNFRREPIYLDDRRLETDHRYRHYAIALRKLPDLAEVRRSLVGRAIHTTPGAWSKQLDALLAR